ncbi:dTDP-4-amino-4,6-dideoxygalactose transaminase [Algoriphagus boseongensis]|uniref:dTDP-4-amino-4,6-dideoxygalactose transaminase n=1 Tax=Algoriphagus boseongensis TaxID=1442587 RepID=A0A4R6TBQ8_9BACT|nr:DegT/DnrJ/EryC1/StrS family aminotransferase [Algoriphagus boseongensis]TDQ19649.1 dTDP-4-amino-4,6-dideoxygalactose transaminase [Algoriphagus boseongensis]
MIPVTKPFIPPLAEYNKYLKGIWKRSWLTNNGPLVNELEIRLKENLGVPYCLYVGNGTIALQMAIKALKLEGEIITTPFSYVATTSSIVWEGCKPVFADIHPKTLNIDPSKIEALITPKTSAILATHCFGNPCAIDEIELLAKKHGLKVIYDAAHCFGTTYKGKSVFHYGDISTTSFHATKLFHSVEGGAVFTTDHGLFEKLGYLRNFGHDGPEKFNGVGINGKNSEFHAAMGLVNLRHVDQIKKRRKDQYSYYLNKLSGSSVQFIQLEDEVGFNYAYFPVIFKSEKVALEVKRVLEINQIFPRRYFYPSLSKLDYVSGNTPISDDISSRILCLPVYHELTVEEQDLVCRFVLNTLN